VDASPRLPVGQLLGRLLHAFRWELYQRARDCGYEDIREAHLQVFGAIDWTGTRLTDLAARSNMTLPAMSELVDELQRNGYLERRPDPDDRRAKRIALTREGRRFLIEGLRAVREIEARYASVVGGDRFAVMVEALGDLVDAEGADAWGPRLRRRGSVSRTAGSGPPVSPPQPAAAPPRPAARARR
jgi:DNA-binding MarR family transcriptional regulator